MRVVFSPLHDIDNWISMSLHH